MTPSLKIYDKILNRLENSEEKLSKVYGIVVRNTLTVLSFHLIDDDEADLVQSFPAEIDIYGILKVGNGQYDVQQIGKLLNEIDVTDNPVFINYNADTKAIEASFYKNGRLEETKCTVVTEQEVLAQFLYVRLRAHVPLFCSQVGPRGLNEAFLNLRKSIASGEMVFNFRKSDVFLLGYEGHEESGVIGITGNPGVGEFCDGYNDPSEGSGRKKKTRSFAIDVLDVDMLKRSTGDVGVGNFKNHAPICVLDKKKDNRMSAIIEIDSLSLFHRQTKVISLYNSLVESAIRNLKLLEQAFLKSIQDNNSDISMPEVFHFYPESCGHFFTRVYLKSDSDSDLVDDRQALHMKLLLPLHQPTFRKANCFLFKTNKDTNGPLFNPHEGVKDSSNGGKISLVKGKYQYYHYCQNKMDDNGWGCAYRSLQTLASWYKCQGYVERDVPTFDEIQRCLVDIGDKPDTFVGSKQWIGSTEVSFVLDTLLKVTSKILYVSSGEEMATKGPELANHFDFHGTPVMIGGGVYAHTILGVDYDSQTGGLKFLVLDPHYTGSEDLNVIQSKGWCGWKGCDFWDKTAYYNMCLPQVPVEV